MWKVIAVAVFLLLQSGYATGAYAVVLGMEGQTYEIHEKDMRTLIKERADGFDFSAWKYRELKRISENYSKFRPVGAVSGLPASRTGQGYRVDMSYTLPYDIYDVNGNIIYPQGFTFNPLALMAKKGLGLDSIIVILNGDNENELKWFTTKFKDHKGRHIKVLLTDGHAVEVSAALGRPVQYLTELLKQKMNIRETPSVVVQSAKSQDLTVKPYALDAQGKEIQTARKDRKSRAARRQSDRGASPREAREQ